MSVNGKGRPRSPGPEVGTVYPHCKIIERLPDGEHYGYAIERYLCQCECGRVFPQTKLSLRKNPTIKCRACRGIDAALTRGDDGRTNTPEWSAWSNMLQRCGNPAAQAYRNYGARGITVCKRWQKFENFLADMGPRPEGLTLERKNNNKGYSPGNCVWATPEAQTRNTRASRYLTANGERKLLVDWARALNTKATTIWLRIVKYGWSEQDACTKPVAPRKKGGG